MAISTKKTATAVLSAILLCTRLSGGIPHTGAQYRVSDLASQEPFSSGLVGVLAVTVAGDTLVEYNSHKRLIPASNVKLLTTGVALNVFGADYGFETTIAYSGTVSGGTLNGDLYIIGGGDPTTGSKAVCAELAGTLFGKWARMLRDSGIRAIDGRVIGDPRWMPSDPVCSSWSYDDIGTYFGAGPTGLNFYENIQEMYIAPGLKAGVPAVLTPGYPDTPWMRYDNECITSGPRTGDGSLFVNTDFGPFASIRGYYGVDNRRKLIECSNRFGAFTCASYFRNYLIQNGINVSGSAADILPSGTVRTDLADFQAWSSTEGIAAAPASGPQAAGTGMAPKAADKLTMIGRTKSPRLAEIIWETNHFSNNFFAESLLHAIGKELVRSAQPDSCLAAMKQSFQQMGLTLTGECRLQDGSGLSRKNYISPSFFVRFLRAMVDTPVFGTYLGSLPQPGGTGSLEPRMKSTPDSVKDRIHMKSGSMNGVRCFSGYITSGDGDPSRTIVFSVMTNNITAGSWTVGPLIDDMIASIAAENR